MGRTSTASSTEVLAGLVDRVTFHNSENGFCVLRVKARGQRDLITLVGHAAMISAGEFVQASGSWTNDRTHGVQFRASFLKATAPTTVEGIEKYLGSGMIRGIGPVYAKKRSCQSTGEQSRRSPALPSRSAARALPPLRAHAARVRRSRWICRHPSSRRLRQIALPRCSSNPPTAYE
jgi:ATP-dependent exoDNAse (exonuclease V) alpha subunit